MTRVSLRREARISLQLCALLPLVACGADSLLTEADPRTAPLLGTETVEVRIRASEMVEWRDTTYSGYAVAQDAGFLLISARPDLEAHTLARFPNIPATFEIDTLEFGVDSFVNAAIRLVVDTAASQVDTTEYEVEVYSLLQSFDAGTVSWEEARSGEPWFTPGGSLGDLLARVKVAVDDTLGPPDTLLARIQVNADSLLKSWRDNQGEPGVAVLVSSPVELRVTSVALRMRATLAERDTVVTFFRSPDPRTFIYDPPPPPVGSDLRVAGIPADRFYFDFVMPDTFEGVPLRGSTINLAELLFYPLPPVPPPFALERAIPGAAFILLANPFIFGPNTPIGPTIDNLTFNPDSLVAGDPVAVTVTASLVNWALSPPDSTPPLRFGVRASPDGQTIQLWDFGSVERPRPREPELRMLVTPNARFRLP